MWVAAQGMVLYKGRAIDLSSISVAMKFPITALLAAVVHLPVVMAFSPANWTWRVLETKPGPLPTRREVATFIRSLEARNISLNLPSHMINLYRSSNSRNYTGLSTHERPVLPEADTVRSLVAKSKVFVFCVTSFCV